MTDRVLLEVTQVMDDETGIWHQGEIEFGIHVGVVEDFLKDYGEEGRDEILSTLEYLKREVGRRYEETLKVKISPEELKSISVQGRMLGKMIEKE